MKVGWLVDNADHTGGAELTQAEFRAAAPDGIDIIDCPAGYVEPDLDLYVVHNCVQYELDDLEPLEGKAVAKYWHDVGPHLQTGVKDWLIENARQVCCSPIQAEHMGLSGMIGCVPPPVDLDRFRDAGAKMNGNRQGIVSVGSWRNHGKAPHRAAEWAQGSLDFYGGGVFAPPDSREIAYEGMPALLARYETFVFLPTVIEPFGRVVAEAWAAGCEIVTNNLVGAKWWIEEDPDKLDTAAADFWSVVLR